MTDIKNRLIGCKETRAIIHGSKKFSTDEVLVALEHARGCERCRFHLQAVMSVKKTDISKRSDEK